MGHIRKIFNSVLDDNRLDNKIVNDWNEGLGIFDGMDCAFYDDLSVLVNLETSGIIVEIDKVITRAFRSSGAWVSIDYISQ